MTRSDALQVFGTDTPSSVPLFSTRSKSGAFTAASFAPNGATRAAAGTASGTIIVYGLDKERDPALQALPGGIFYTADAGDGVASLAWSPDGTLIVVGTAKGSVHIFLAPAEGSAPTFGPLVSFTVHTGAVSALAISPDGKLLLSGDASGQLRLTNAAWADAGSATCGGASATAHALGDAGTLGGGKAGVAVVDAAFRPGDDATAAVAIADGRTLVLELGLGAIAARAEGMAGDAVGSSACA